MASSENLEKRAEELFETLTDEDLENPKVFLDKKRRDIQNQAKELVKDIDDIIKCLENYHKTCGAFRAVGHIADASGIVRLLTTTALYLLTGGPPSAVLALAATVTSLAGVATSTVATAAEAILEKKQVKSVREKMETLKEHIRDYVLYSDMVDQFVAASGETQGKLQASGKRALVASQQLHALLGRSAAKASTKLFSKAVAFGSIGTLCSTIYNLVSEIKELDKDKQTEVMKGLQVLKHNLEDIAQGKF